MTKATTNIMAIILGTAIVIAGVLLLAINRFNAHELETLRSGADARGENYQVIIHNRWLNTYSFLPAGDAAAGDGVVADTTAKPAR